MLKSKKLYRSLSILERKTRSLFMAQNETGEKKRYSFKDYSAQVLKIEQATNLINAAVQEMPLCSARKSFELSVKNLYKKIQKITPEGKTIMTDEEKEMLQKFREGKITFTETTIAPIKEQTDEVSIPETEVKIVKKSKKH